MAEEKKSNATKSQNENELFLEAKQQLEREITQAMNKIAAAQKKAISQVNQAKNQAKKELQQLKTEVIEIQNQTIITASRARGEMALEKVKSITQQTQHLTLQLERVMKTLDNRVSSLDLQSSEELETQWEKAKTAYETIIKHNVNLPKLLATAQSAYDGANRARKVTSVDEKIRQVLEVQTTAIAAQDEIQKAKEELKQFQSALPTPTVASPTPSIQSSQAPIIEPKTVEVLPISERKEATTDAIVPLIELQTSSPREELDNWDVVWRLFKAKGD